MNPTFSSLNSTHGCCKNRPAWHRAILGILFVGVTAGPALADDFLKEPINYSKAPANNLITRLQQRVDSGKTKLVNEKHFGYLRSVLKELKVPESSQMLVFSKTSLQRHRISPRTPRALYFNDDVYIGFCQQGDVMEVSAVDPHLGTVFYTLDQTSRKSPKFARRGDSCLICHGSSQTHNVPGHLVRSVFPDRRGLPILSAGTYRIDHSSPLKNRWGGWYVTGTHGNQPHLGNLIVTTREAEEPIDNKAGMNMTCLDKKIDRAKYLAMHSDLVALMVLEHQVEAHNLLTQAAFQTRIALYKEIMLNRELKLPATHRWDSTRSQIRSVGDQLVSYLLFSEEAEITQKIAGTSNFSKEFVGLGPRDGKGRSLRDFDLQKRLFKYPCSYLIYSASFEAMPGEVKDYVLLRIWNVLTGKDTSKTFSHLSGADRKAIKEILVATKPNLPKYWKETERRKK